MLNHGGREFDAIVAMVAEEVDRPVHPAVRSFAELVRQRYEPSVAGIIYYGSCLRQGDQMPPADDSVLDFYVLVDRYREAYRRPLLAMANRVLPPNVFYLEGTWQGRMLRAKYAVISLGQFRKGTSRRSFHAALWARFAQPSRLVFARDNASRGAICEALGEAVVTLAARTVPLLQPRFTARDLWTRAFRESYRAELRAEPPGRALSLHDADAGRYGGLTPLALKAAGFAFDLEAAEVLALRTRAPMMRRRLTAAGWLARRVVGKLVHGLRLLKAILTFENGLRYVLWKIERHSGVRLSVTPWQLRHPFVCSPLLAWRLYRRGAFR